MQILLTGNRSAGQLFNSKKPQNAAMFNTSICVRLRIIRKDNGLNKRELLCNHVYLP